MQVTDLAHQVDNLAWSPDSSYMYVDKLSGVNGTIGQLWGGMRTTRILCMYTSRVLYTGFSSEDKLLRMLTCLYYGGLATSPCIFFEVYDL